MKPKTVEKELYHIPIRNTSTGKIERKTLLKKDHINHMTKINELGPQVVFVSYTRPKLSDAAVNTNILQDLEKLLDDNKKAFAEDDRQISITPLTKMAIDTGDHKPIAKKPYILSIKHYD